MLLILDLTTWEVIPYVLAAELALGVEACWNTTQ